MKRVAKKYEDIERIIVDHLHNEILVETFSRKLDDEIERERYDLFLALEHYFNGRTILMNVYGSFQ